MEEQDRLKLSGLIGPLFNESLSLAIVSNPRDRGEIEKVKIRPVRIKNVLLFQAEEFKGGKAYHKNMEQPEAVAYLIRLLDTKMRQAELADSGSQARILVGKSGSVSIKVRKKPVPVRPVPPPDLTHNRIKQYILEDGKPVDFLAELGVMTREGKVVKAKYDKFRQINRFLEFIEDVLPVFGEHRDLTIIDFGCGKSYLTFAMYYYLNEIKGYCAKIIGLDLKQDVVDRCQRLSDRLGYEGLAFLHGDIASYEGLKRADMVVTLHACDTATDYAIEKAVRWGASVILSVPCCQHELNGQIKNDILEPVLHYGLVKERLAALITDSLRAEILENLGYRTQLLEFIEMEHTPKNILIRAIRQGGKKNNTSEIQKIMDFLNVSPTLAELLLSNKKS